MPEQVEIRPCGPLNAVVRPPGSKSITNRALICAALADGESTLRGALDSDDTRVMVTGLRQLGLAIQHDVSANEIRVTGCGGRIPKVRAEIHVENSGTTIRFLTAMLAACEGQFRLDGIARMRERPIGDLVQALRDLGGGVRCEADNNCPPVIIDSRGLEGGSATIRGDISSQFLSGILMAAPYAQRPTQLAVSGVLVSQPYVHMTLAVMAAFGIALAADDLSRFEIPANKKYRGSEYEIEPDASAASYFWGAAAICGGQVTVTGLHRDSLQGDVRFCERLKQMGCEVQYESDAITVRGGPLRGIDVDMNDISDTVQTLAAVALFAQGTTTIRGVAHNRHKETDRIADLATELRRLGAVVDEFDDGLRITPQPLQPAAIETYNDHRMAMSLALVGLRQPGIVIRNPGCTAKTYPRFFADLDAMREAADG